MTHHPHWGSTLDGFLTEQGVLHEVRAIVEKVSIATRFTAAMRAQKNTKKPLADMIGTRRTQVDKLLDPHSGNVTLDTWHRAASASGKRIEVAPI
jgi:hypothetical protein